MTCDLGCECGQGPDREIQLDDGAVLKIWEGPVVDLTEEVDPDETPALFREVL